MSEAKNTSFWRGFTWKRWLMFSLIFYAYRLIILATSENDWSQNFDVIHLVKKAVGAAIVGLIFTIWYEPGDLKK